MPKWSMLGDKKHPKTGQISPVLGWSIGLIQRKLIRTSLDRFINKDHKKIFYSCQNGLG
jgi:hypothetical protein